MTNRMFWVRLFISGAVFLLISSSLSAQAPMVSFDSLFKPRATDSARHVPIQAKRRVDAVRRPRVDTVRVAEHTIDTVYVAATATPTAQPAAKSAAAPALTFAPPLVSGLIQVQLTGGDAALRSTYRVRRAEIKVVSDLGRKSQAVLMIDAAKALAVSTSGTATSVTQSSRVLQDAYLVFPLFGTQIEAGQQRLPLSYEGSFGSSGLEVVDRALMESDRARGGSFGDVRDLGLAARGKWRALDYRAGVFNGSGESMSETDRNSAKAVVAQLGVRPFVKGLRVGASGATSGAATGDKPARDRTGVDVQFARGRALIQAEAMAGRDAAIVRHGMNAFATWNIARSLKSIVRFDAWDPNINLEDSPATVTERDYLAGFTWLPAATRLKVQVNVVRKTYTRDLVPALTQVLTQVQASW